ncbi:MAG: hypothetical protein Q4C10_00930 [Clostridia bacterium]|nr:hypothetical protein [Clostridia bacterium]
MRYWLAVLLLALLLTGGALSEELLCVVAPGVTALVDESGADRIPNGTYEEIFAVREGELYAVGRRSEYRLCDGEGRLLGETEFSMICDEGDCLVYRDGALYGALNARGEVVLEAAWSQLTSSGTGGWLAMEGDILDDQPDEILVVDAAGEARSTGVHAVGGLSPVSDGRMPYMTSGGLYGAIDAGGRVVIAPRLRYLGAFSGGAAIFSDGEGTGLMDVDGRELIPPKYACLLRSAGMIVGAREDGLDVFSPDGHALRASLPGRGLEASLPEGGLIVRDGAQTRLYGEDGALMLQGDAGLTVAPGAAGQFIASDGAWGEACQWLVNPDGSAASDRRQRILPLCPGRYAWMEMDGSEYYSAELGGIQTSWDYGSLRYGLMDGGGVPLTAAEYREIRWLGGERLLMVSEDAVCLADLNGATVRTWVTSEEETPVDGAAGGESPAGNAASREADDGGAAGRERSGGEEPMD